MKTINRIYSAFGVQVTNPELFVAWILFGALLGGVGIYASSK